MKRAAVYFVLCFKRAMRLFPAILAVSGLLFAVLAVILVGTVRADSLSNDKQKFRVAIVGHSEEGFLEMGIAMLNSIDSSRFMVETLQMSEPEARGALERGSLHAYAVIPDGYIESAMSGDVGKIRFVTTHAAMDMSTVFKNEIAALVSSILVHSQKGVYATSALMKSEGLSGRQDAMNELALEYIALILDRSELYTVETVGHGDELSLGGYLFCGGLVLFVSLWGISCFPLFARRSTPLSRLLKAKRLSGTCQILCEYLAYLAVMLLSVFILLLFILPVTSAIGSFIPELEGVGFGGLCLLFLRLVLPCAAIAALSLLIYELISGTVGAVIGQFILAVALCFAGGCLYPIHFLPDPMISLSAYLPTAMAHGFISSFFTGGYVAAQALGLCAFLILAVGLTALVRSLRLGRDEA